MGHWMYLFVYLLVCFYYVFVSERAGLFAGKTLRPFWARRRNEDSGRQGNTHQPAHNLEKSEEKNTLAFIIFFIGPKSDLCLAGSVSQSVALLRLDACDPGV